MSARVLAIADAYDAMISDRVYRQARSQEAAFGELRRFSGTQFDPELVQRFIAAVKDHEAKRRPNVSALSPQSAVALGQHVERLAVALDRLDLRGLAALAGRFNETAMRFGAEDLANIASQLQVAAKEETEMKTIVELTSDLMNECLNAQSTFFVGGLPQRRQYEHPGAPPVSHDESVAQISQLLSQVD